jgi:hypothetical protein
MPSNVTENIETSNELKNKVKWSKEDKASFKENIDTGAVNNLIEELDSYKSDTICQGIIDELACKIKSIFHISATKSNIMKQCKGKRQWNRKNTRKPWYNDRCEEKRKLFFEAKNNCKVNRTEENDMILKDCSKLYKKELKSAYYNYYKEFNVKLKTLKKGNPKEFWKLLKSDNTASDVNENNVTLDQFAEHFKTLNDGEVIPQEVENKLFKEAEGGHNMDVNYDFTEEEILLCIKNLKLIKRTV